MKSCKTRSGLLDLDRDIPTTPEDCAALQEFKRLDGMSTDEYFRFLARFAAAFPPQVLRARPGPGGDKPFTL